MVRKNPHPTPSSITKHPVMKFISNPGLPEGVVATVTSKTSKNMNFAPVFALLNFVYVTNSQSSLFSFTEPLSIFLRSYWVHNTGVGFGCNERKPTSQGDVIMQSETGQHCYPALKLFFVARVQPCLYSLAIRLQSKFYLTRVSE